VVHRPVNGFRRLAVAAAGVTYLLIVMGGIVRVTGSGLGCGLKNDWPLCNGGLLPPLQPTAVIEFTHRWIAALATALVIALTIAAWLSQRRDRRIVIASTVAAVLFLVQIVLGALTVEYRLPGGIVLIHLANALLLLGALTYIAITSVFVGAASGQAVMTRRPLQLSAVAAAGTYLLALSGALVVETGSSAGCAGWPLCGAGFQLPASQMDAINLVHRVVAGIVVLLIGGVMAVVIRNHRGRGLRPIRVAAIAVTAVLLLQIAAGALVVDLRLPPAAQAVHLALASALWASVVMVTVLTWRALATPKWLPAEGVHIDARRPTQVGAPS